METKAFPIGQLYHSSMSERKLKFYKDCEISDILEHNKGDTTIDRKGISKKFTFLDTPFYCIVISFTIIIRFYKANQ